MSDLVVFPTKDYYGIILINDESKEALIMTDENVGAKKRFSIRLKLLIIFGILIAVSIFALNFWQCVFHKRL
ncbi:hypothetical protein HMPREF9554_01020 [Treponema phagedenis F0421]|nr:hypothetical protein HMPREF9554_01020 [Treponema phagedenis F0421]